MHRSHYDVLLNIAKNTARDAKDTKREWTKRRASNQSINQSIDFDQWVKCTRLQPINQSIETQLYFHTKSTIHQSTKETRTAVKHPQILSSLLVVIHPFIGRFREKKSSHGKKWKIRWKNLQKKRRLHHSQSSFHGVQTTGIKSSLYALLAIADVQFALRQGFPDGAGLLRAQIIRHPFLPRVRLPQVELLILVGHRQDPRDGFPYQATANTEENGNFQFRISFRIKKK